MYRWVRERHMIGIRGRNFMEAPWAGGIVLLGCVIIAMLLANLPATSLYYRHLLETDLSLMVHSPDGLIDWGFPRGMTVEKLINDGLMVIFFFAVGLEIKREIVCGQLSSAKKALLPVLAAAGGMLFPAIIFTAFNHGTMAANGWGIPTATDIAFAIGILSMLGDRVPVSLKIFLTALAIADDLGAILVIALFYGGQVQIGCLLAALAIMPAVFAFGIAPNSGPALMFITLPRVFQQMPGGRVLAVLFFLSVLFAGITSLINMLEAVSDCLGQGLGLPRTLSTLLVGAVVFGVGLFLEALPDMGAWMDLITIYIAPFGAVLGAVFIYWVLGLGPLRQELMLGRERPLWRGFGPLAHLYVVLTAAVWVLGIVYGGIG